MIAFRSLRPRVPLCLLICTLASLMPACSVPAHSESGFGTESFPTSWTTHRDPIGFSIEHPDDWEVEGDPESGQVNLYSPEDFEIIVWPVFIRRPIESDEACRTQSALLSELGFEGEWSAPRQAGRGAVRSILNPENGEKGVAVMTWVPTSSWDRVRPTAIRWGVPSLSGTICREASSSPSTCFPKDMNSSGSSRKCPDRRSQIVSCGSASTSIRPASPATVFKRRGKRTKAVQSWRPESSGNQMAGLDHEPVLRRSPIPLLPIPDSRLQIPDLCSLGKSQSQTAIANLRIDGFVKSHILISR